MSRTWADDFRTYDEACEYYGVDTPAQIASELAADAAEEWIAEQDAIEMNGGPIYRAPAIDWGF